MSSFEELPLDVIKATYDLIAPYIVRTPVLTSDYFSRRVSEAVDADVKLYFKAEPFQKTGSFKARGAISAVLAAKAADGDSLRGVFTHSSGNLGAAIGWAAQQVGIKAAAVVLKVASPAKLANICAYDTEIVKTDFSPQAVSDACQEIIRTKGYRFISPYDEPEEVAGQATIAMEFLEDFPYLDAILAPTSGGGLVSGLCVGGKQLKPSLKVFAVAPRAKSLAEALRTSERPCHWSPANFVDTKCDALRAHPGQLTFPIMCQLLEKDVFEVTDNEAVAAMRLAWQHLHLTLEISSSTAIAAIFSEKFVNVVRKNGLRHIGIVLTGGNVNLDSPPPWL